MATTPTTGSSDQSVIANFKTAQEEATVTQTSSKKSNSRETKYVSVEQSRTKKASPDSNSPTGPSSGQLRSLVQDKSERRQVFQVGTPVVKLATQGRSDADIAGIAKTLYDKVSNRATDGDFNATWQNLNLSADEKKRVFEEMAKLPGGVGFYLDAKAGRKFTQPINEFAQWATTNRGADVADFIAGKGNDWNNDDYNQAYANWIQPAENKDAFFDRTAAIGLNHWQGLRGTRNETSLVKEILAQSLRSDSSQLTAADKAVLQRIYDHWDDWGFNKGVVFKVPADNNVNPDAKADIEYVAQHPEILEKWANPRLDPNGRLTKVALGKLLEESKQGLDTTQLSADKAILQQIYDHWDDWGFHNGVSFKAPADDSVPPEAKPSVEYIAKHSEILKKWADASQDSEGRVTKAGLETLLDTYKLGEDLPQFTRPEAVMQQILDHWDDWGFHQGVVFSARADDNVNPDAKQYVEFIAQNRTMLEAWGRYSQDPDGKLTKASLEKMLTDYKNDRNKAVEEYRDFLKNNPSATEQQRADARDLMLVRGNQIFIRGADDNISADELKAFVAADPGFGAGVTAAATKWSADDKIALLDTAGDGVAPKPDKLFTAANIDNYIPQLAMGLKPWQADYFHYIDTDKLPGKDGTINQLAFKALLEEYKDAKEGSNERKFYDLMMAQALLQSGYSADTKTDKFDASLSGDDIKNNVIDPDKLDAELNKLYNDKSFAESFDARLAEKTNTIIKESFVLVDGKITLKTDSNKNAPSVDGTTWARAALDYARSDQGKQEYHLDTDAEKKAFIQKYIGALSSLVTPEETSAALGELGISDATTAVLNTDLQSISDEDLATGLEQAGLWLMRARSRLNMIGNISTVSRADWIELARAIKLTAKQGGNPSNIEKVISNMDYSKLLPEKGTAFVETLRELGRKGYWGSLAALAGYAGAVITYGFDAAARERLKNGDPREVMNLLNDVTLSMSYASAQVKGPGNLLGLFGVTSAKEFVDQFSALPGFGRLAGSLSTEMQPTFKDVAQALDGVNLRDKDAVKAALANIDANTKAKWAKDIGYDFNQLADRIVAHANDYSLTNRFTLPTEAERLGFLFDMTSVDKNYKNFARAEKIIQLHQSVDINDEAKLRQILSEGGMATDDIDSVISEMKAMGAQTHLGANGMPPAADFPNNIRGQFLDTLDSKVTGDFERIFVDPDVDGRQLLSQSILDEYVKANPNVGAGRIAPKGSTLRTSGIAIKALGAAMDVIGGALGVGMGIYDIVKGAKDSDKIKIAVGSMGIASGVLGAMGGLAGFGLLAPPIAVPLYIIAAGIGLVGLFISIFTGDNKTPADQFADSMTDRFDKYGITRPDANNYLSTWYADHYINPMTMRPKTV